MKKYIFIIVLVFVGLITFAACTNSLSVAGEISEYTQDLVLDYENKTLLGKQVVNYYNDSSDTLPMLKFHLYPNAFRENAKASVVSQANFERAYPNGKSYGKIDIKDVSHINNNLEFVIDGTDENILTVTLSEPLLPQSRYGIEISFEVTFPNINHRFGYGENTLNFGNYYPIACVYENGDFVTDLYNSNGDPFYSKCANYKVSLTLDDSLVVASTGSQSVVETKQYNDIDTSKFKTLQICANNVRDFAFTTSKNFKVIDETHNGINILYYYYKDERPTESFEVIKKILDFNADFAGKYPYRTYSVAESNFVHGGMEYPQLVLISDDLEDYDTYVNVIVHETCHQWWYGLVGDNEYNCGWFDEGLTDYNTAIFYDAYPEYKLNSKTIMKNAEKSYTKFVSVYSDIYENLDTSMTRNLNEYPTEYEYVYCTYTKGMLLFNSLKELLGEKRFNKCIKTLYNTYCYKEVDAEKIIDCLSRASGKNLETYVNSWLSGKMKILGA